jgi:hypothetical protein
MHLQLCEGEEKKVNTRSLALPAMGTGTMTDLVNFLLDTAVLSKAW